MLEKVSQERGCVFRSGAEGTGKAAQELCRWGEGCQIDVEAEAQGLEEAPLPLHRVRGPSHRLFHLG